MGRILWLAFECLTFESDLWCHGHRRLRWSRKLSLPQLSIKTDPRHISCTGAVEWWQHRIDGDCNVIRMWWCENVAVMVNWFTVSAWRRPMPLFMLGKAAVYLFWMDPWSTQKSRPRQRYNATRSVSSGTVETYLQIQKEIKNSERGEWRMRMKENDRAIEKTMCGRIEKEKDDKAKGWSSQGTENEGETCCNKGR